MSLSIGIVGLPNVGKSTLFNALTHTQNATVANYPFCTIKPHHGVVPLSDPRVEELVKLVHVPHAIHATIDFVDLAGLVKGASQGEGLGNQFLANIRDTDAIVHVVRCFDDENVVHISAQPDPVTDIEIVNLELMLADVQQLERKIEKLHSAVKGDKKLGHDLELAQELREHLAHGKPALTFPNQDDEHVQALLREMRFLSSKPVIYAANVDEAGLAEENDYVRATRQVAAQFGAEVVVMCGLLEMDMADMTEVERKEFLELAGVEEGGLEQVIRKSFRMLDLISFFTKNENEVRAWNVKRGTHAPQAAGMIHTDFERGFIAAEVVPYEVFVKYGSDHALRTAGLLHLHGKDYVVQDGDVIYFRFNV